MIQQAYRLTISLTLILLLTTTAYAQSSFTYKPGNGINWSSEDESARFRILGYIQATTNSHEHFDESNPGNQFFVRRARLDVDFDYLETYQIFFEWDARGSRTEMVLAQLDIRYWNEHTIRVGKYITPFSVENYRSSRSLSTIERYNALNSLFLSPSLDTQYGVMLFARYPQFEYYLSLSNGNGQASQNIRENNNAKDFQARLVYKATSSFQAGAAFNLAIEETEPLSLVDHQFNRFNTLSVSGKRLGYIGDLAYRSGNWSVRGEAFRLSFMDTISPENQAKGFWGGYAELGYFLFGNQTDGFQIVSRFEQASYIGTSDSINGPETLRSFLLGHNWYKDGIFRFQTNLIYELTDKRSQLADTRLSGKDSALLVMTMLQLKF